MLARDRERLRHARMLHDRVLQTMETLARGQWIADATLKARVAEEATWLRGLVEGTDEATGGDLLGEALTNVIKHAATASAVLRLTATPEGLVVTVLDQGRGFDPVTQPEGMGLTESIRGRVTESGGMVRIDTAPGAGTYLEITMPLASGTHQDSGGGSPPGHHGRGAAGAAI